MDFGFPGRFMTNVLPLIPAVCRLSTAVGTYFKLIARICSPYPGIIRWHTASVASGVTSLGAGPVPPVVTTRQQPHSSACAVQRSVLQYHIATYADASVCMLISTGAAVVSTTESDKPQQFLTHAVIARISKQCICVLKHRFKRHIQADCSTLTQMSSTWPDALHDSSAVHDSPCHRITAMHGASAVFQ